MFTLTWSSVYIRYPQHVEQFMNKEANSVLSDLHIANYQVGGGPGSQLGNIGAVETIVPDPEISKRFNMFILVRRDVLLPLTAF